MYSNPDFKILDFGSFGLFMSPKGILSPYIPTQKPIIVSEGEYHNGIVDDIKNLIESGSYVVIRGSFDHFHRGHQLLIDTAYDIFPNSFFVFNVSTDEYNTSIRKKRKMHSERIQSYKIRIATIRRYIELKDLVSRAEIVPLNDVYGEVVSNALVRFNVFGNDKRVLESIYGNMYQVNLMRYQRGLEIVYLVLIPTLTTEKGDIISSTLIRGDHLRDQEVFS